MMYGNKYLEKRRGSIDRSEWIDILSVLKAMKVPKDARIVELGAGEGLLIRFLRAHGYTNIVGYDLLHEDEYVVRADLREVLPQPPFDVCISQHFLEHIPQDRAVQLAKWCLEHGWLFIAVVPGHHVDDPTHVVDHYEYEDLISFAEKVGAPFYRIEPDSLSYANPAVRDWIVILSKKPIPRRTKPLLLNLFILFTKFLIRLYLRAGDNI